MVEFGAGVGHGTVRVALQLQRQGGSGTIVATEEDPIPFSFR